MGSKLLHRLFWSANHETVAALQAPDAATGADIEIVNALGVEFFSPAYVVDVVRVPAIDHDIILLETGSKVAERPVDHCRWHHHPSRPRWRQPLDKLV